MIFESVLDKMFEEGKTSHEITEWFAQELFKAQEKTQEKAKEREKREKEKEEKLAALLGQISEIMSCYFSELYDKITPEAYNKYMNISELNDLIYTIVKDMYLESIEEEENKKLAF